MFRRAKTWLIRAALLLVLLWVPNVVVSLTRDGPSVCRGSTSNGSLENGRRISGAEVRSYCWLCARFLRTYAHNDVARTVSAAYGMLNENGDLDPPLIDYKVDWVYGESGWPWGGSFKPHRTHQNGLSVDFMVPLKDGARFPTHLLNRFGYDEEFDSNGRGEAGEIDFQAMAVHLLQLETFAREYGGRIRRVILAPDLQDNLFAAKGLPYNYNVAGPLGSEVKSKITFNTRQAWVRHDDHYHVDFDFPCEGT